MNTAVQLSKGGNAPISGPRAVISVDGRGGTIDVSAVLLDDRGKVRSDSDLVFFNHPHQDGVTLSGASITAELGQIPASVHTVAVVASVDSEYPAATFTAGTTPSVTIDSEVRHTFTPLPLQDRETVVTLVELYRRGGGWKVRAVGQGYANGLAGLATDLGIQVDDPGPTSPAPARTQPPAPAAAPVPPPPPVATQPIVTAPPYPPAPTPPYPPAPAPAAYPSAYPPGPAPAAPYAPAPYAPAPAPPGVPAPTSAAAGAQAPAISLAKVQHAAPGLVDLYKTAGVSLDKKGLTGQRAAVYLVMDHSGSMGGFYANGTMQRLAEQILGLSANLDDDGTVPLVFFSSGVDLIADIGLANYTGRIQTLHAQLRWGGTAFAPAMQAVIDHYRASGATDPAFVVFQTDGVPGDRKRTQALLRKASTLPIFWQFVGFGKSRNLRFLRDLDTLSGRAIDNAGFFEAGERPLTRSDSDVYDQLMNEFPRWLAASRAAGIVT